MLVTPSWGGGGPLRVPQVSFTVSTGLVAGEIPLVTGVGVCLTPAGVCRESAKTKFRDCVSLKVDKPEELLNRKAWTHRRRRSRSQTMF